MNPHFASLVFGLSHQAEAALSGQLPPGAEGLLVPGRQASRGFRPFWFAKQLPLFNC